MGMVATCTPRVAPKRLGGGKSEINNYLCTRSTSSSVCCFYFISRRFIGRRAYFGPCSSQVGKSSRQFTTSKVTSKVGNIPLLPNSANLRQSLLRLQSGVFSRCAEHYFPWYPWWPLSCTHGLGDVSPLDLSTSSMLIPPDFSSILL